MKKIIVTLLICLIGKLSIAQNYNPAVWAGTVNPAPLINGFGTLKFNVGNSGNDALNNLAQPMVLIITLSYGAPTGQDPIAAISGTYANRFSWIYDAPTKSYQGTQILPIPSFGAGTILIGYVATLPSIALNPQNGFNVNVIPPAYTNASNASGDDNVSSYTFGSTPIVTPVKLAYYNAVITNCSSVINWKSITEGKFSRYEVEYSKDGIRFDLVSTVNSQGDNHAYSTTHNSGQGKAYYRLKMIDLDGKYEYSNVIMLDVRCGKSTISVFPNPATTLINVNISGVDARGTMATLINTAGQVVLNKNLQNGTNQLDVSKFAAGIYHLKLVSNTGTENIKVLID